MPGVPEKCQWPQARYMHLYKTRWIRDTSYAGVELQSPENGHYILWGAVGKADKNGCPHEEARV